MELRETVLPSHMNIYVRIYHTANWNIAYCMQMRLYTTALKNLNVKKESIDNSLYYLLFFITVEVWKSLVCNY